MRKLKNDDRGVTLVEIIVSIAILAIIVLPFLNAFVTATKTNVKAKNEMNATHLATNIMEGIEKNSMKTLAYQFNYPSEGFDVADGFNISDGSSACELLKKKKSVKFDNVKRFEDISDEIVNKDDVITSCIHKTDASAKIGDTSLWDFRESNAHKYYFYMSGVQSGTKKYNALVTVDAKFDASNKDETGKPNNKVTEYNMDEVADMSAMDAKFDCMSADNADKYSATKIISEFNNMNPGLSVQQSDIKRTITIDIEKIDIKKSGAASNKAAKVTVSYSYSINKNGVKKTFPDSALKDDYTMVIYDNSSDTVNRNLRNVYLFYQPWYTSTGTTFDTCNDVIIINNKDKLDCTVNIVKQKTTISDQSELSTKESTYKAAVKVSEPGNRTGHAYTHIATNLNVDMGAPDKTPQPNQAIYKFNTNVNPRLVKAIVDIQNLTKSKASERLYDVKVAVYESKASLDDIFNDKDPVVTMTGSMGY